MSREYTAKEKVNLLCDIQEDLRLEESALRWEQQRKILYNWPLKDHEEKYAQQTIRVLQALEILLGAHIQK